MTNERILDLADSAAKHDDENIYRLNLLGRTTKGKPIDAMIFKKMAELLTLMRNAPPQIREIWQGHFDGYLSAMTVTSSENGWFTTMATTISTKHEQTISEQKKQTNRMFGLGGNSNNQQA